MYDARTPRSAEAEEPIHGEMTIAEVLAAVPEARSIFQEHDFDPVAYCGPTVHIIRLDETPAHCKLKDLEGLLVKFNAAYRRTVHEPLP